MTTRPAPLSLGGGGPTLTPRRSSLIVADHHLFERLGYVAGLLASNNILGLLEVAYTFATKLVFADLLPVGDCAVSLSNNQPHPLDARSASRSSPVLPGDIAKTATSLTLESDKSIFTLLHTLAVSDRVQIPTLLSSTGAGASKALRVLERPKPEPVSAQEYKSCRLGRWNRSSFQVLSRNHRGRIRHRCWLRFLEKYHTIELAQPSRV